ncbi:MAG: methyltransferase domain-containing protein [Ruminococcus sp.]|nr:methyltransferase domain-containing protein [Ruminococcus sp.]
MYICPVCKKKLKKLDNVFHCQNGHSFDIARKGYVNLLTTKKRDPSKSGDKAEMVKARTAFLDKDYYRPLAEKTASLLKELLDGKKNSAVIDSGCGEGYYTCIYAHSVPEALFFGVDISKSAVSHCMTRVHVKKLKNCEFCVASSFELPFKNEMADVVVSTFAPVSNDEYARVLKKGGKLVVVSPSSKHLFELKSAVYDKPYDNAPNNYALSKFELERSEIFEYTRTLETTQEIIDLFTMTPYFFKTSVQGLEKLKRLDSLEVTCGFDIRIYKRIF